MDRIIFLIKNPLFLFKYLIFIFKYFNNPISIIIKHLKNKEIQKVNIRNGGIFNSYGYGSTSLSLYKIWGDYEYGIKPKDVNSFKIAIDIGAHVGLFSVFLALLNPQCKILSFEMDKNNFINLKKNIKNCKVKNIIPFNYAVSGKSQLINYYPGRGSSEFSIKKIAFSDKRPSIDENKNAFAQVKSVTLNDIIEQNKIDSIDFLKIDCEGAEYDIIYSTSEKNLKKIKKMGGEFHEYISKKNNYSVVHLIKYLSKYGDIKKIELSNGIGLLFYIKK